MTTTKSKPFVIGVGVDTARYGHHVTFLGPDRQRIGEPLSVIESHEGYARLAKRLDRLRAKHDGAFFHVHIDAAGQYAANFEAFVRALDIPKTVSVGEPKRNQDYHRAVSPKRKADASESYAMARFAVAETPPETPEAPEEFRLLREIAGRLEGQVKSETQAINRLHNLMARVFPELATLAPCLGAAWVLRLLKEYPTPQRISQARQASLEKIPRVTTSKAQQVHATAKTSVGSLRGELAEELVACAVADVERCQHADKRLETLLMRAFDALEESGHRRVESIPGIGRITAAILVAKIIDITRFETPEKLVGYFGVFPEEYSSGVDKSGTAQIRSAHMSRKGNDLVRRYLFCAAKSAITHNPAVRALYKRLRARGTRGDVALGHAMRKLLHLVFAVWASDKSFDKQHFPWEDDHNALETPQEQPSSSQAEATAQQEAAGHKQDEVPTRKVVTTAQPSVEERPAAVNTTLETPKKPSVDFAYIREQVSIEQVLGRLGYADSLRGQGAERRGPCPIHEACNRRSRSFSVNLEKNVFQCFHPQCAGKGNALDLWAAARSETVYEAALSLAETFYLKTSRHREEEHVSTN